MERKVVGSSMIGSIGYDSTNGTLEVEFKKGGSIWQYYDVPEHIWNDFEYTASHGKYFLANIKKQYREARIG